jgi:hypothetical protein
MKSRNALHAEDKQTRKKESIQDLGNNASVHRTWIRQSKRLSNHTRKSFYKNIDLFCEKRMFQCSRPSQRAHSQLESRKNAPYNPQHGSLHGAQQRITYTYLGIRSEVRSVCAQPKSQASNPGRKSPHELLEGKSP